MSASLSPVSSLADPPRTRGAGRALGWAIEGPWLLRHGVWLGLLAAALELAHHALGKLAPAGVSGLSIHAAWMTPLADVLLVGGAAALALALRRIAPRVFGDRFVLFCPWLAATLTVLLSSRLAYLLYFLGVLILACGIAVNGAALALRYRRGWDRLVRLTIWPLLALAVLACPVTFAREAWSEYRRQAALPAAAGRRPNVLLITLDTVRTQSMSLYGYPRPTTPQLARWAERGVVFDWAWATSNFTLPSHATMLTGRYPRELNCSWGMPLDDAYPVLAEVLAAEGYVSGGFVANTIYCGPEFGLARGFTHFEGHPVSAQQVIKSSSLLRKLTTGPESTGETAASWWLRHFFDVHQPLARKSADDINAAFLRWQARQAGRPFFAFLNYYDSHHPYLPPAPYAAQFDSQAGRVRRNHSFPAEPWELTPAEVRAEQDAYDGTIAYQDDALDRLLAELQRRGVLDDTLVIVTSDHGEQFGERTLFLHGNSLYVQLCRVPLIILPPQAARPDGPVRVADSITLRDLAATVLDLTGAPADALPGKSLTAHWRPGGAAGGQTSPIIADVERLPMWHNYPVARGDLHSLVSGPWHLLANSDGTLELFNYRADPLETRNLAGNPDHIDDLEQLRGELAAVPIKKRVGQPADPPPGAAGR